MLESAILPTSYFPPIKYFQCLNNYSPIYIEHAEHYKKHTIRNRTEILGTNGSLLLTIPIKKKHYSKTMIKNIKIADNSWKKNHINSIKSAYGSAPFFIHYFNQIEKIINNNYTFLIDLNNDILKYFIDEIRIKTKIYETSSYIKKYPKHFIDERETIKINRDLKYYQQVFGSNFISNLSIIDLIFNVGPDTKKYIRAVEK